MHLNFDILQAINLARSRLDLMKVQDVLELAERDNLIFDPFSVLISKQVKIGNNNIFYPCVTLVRKDDFELAIGDRNIFHTGTMIAAELGPVTIGNANQFGEGGFTAKANRSGAWINIGDNGRYLGGASVFGQTDLGSGSQLLGMIMVDSCRLGAGESFSGSNPDKRGSLLKGAGTARNLHLNVGEVIQGNGSFLIENLKLQSTFHAKA